MAGARRKATRKAPARAAAPEVPSGILSRLHGLLPSLGPASRRLADFFIAHAADVIHMSITEVAERTGASEGSVIALCRHIGATGFQQLKIALAQDLVQPVQFIHEDLDPTDKVGTVVEKIFASGIQALRDTMSVLSPKAMERAVRLIREAERVEVYGIGSAAPIAEDVHYRMLRIGINARVCVDSHVQAISAALAGPRVAVLTVSHSGSTRETVMATRLAKEAGARTICITNYGRSPLIAYADVVLNTMARETQFRTEAMTSRIAQLGIVDALIACLALDNYDASVETIRRTFEVLSLKRY